MIAVRGDSLYIGQPGKYGYRRYVLGLDQVALLEAREATPGASAAFSAAEIVLLTGTALIVVVLVALSRMDLGGMN